MINIRKRDGRIVEFDINKIEKAILKAFFAIDNHIDDYAIDKAKNIVQKKDYKKVLLKYLFPLIQ